MQNRRFYVPEIPAAGGALLLPADEAVHAVRVLRLAEGDALQVLDGRGTVADAEVVSVTGGSRRPAVACRVSSREVAVQPRPRIRLYVAPPRSRLMGELVQAATELGLWCLSPILCERSVSRPGPEVVDRWLQDAVTALKQSGNPYLPRIEAPEPVAAALRACEAPGVFGAVPGDDTASRPVDIRGVPCVGVWIGPEGGFSDSETAALLDAGLVPVTVGPYVLRVETAASALLGWLHGRYHSDDLLRR